MGKAKKLRTMQRTVAAIARQELDRIRKKKFDDLIRGGIIFEDCDKAIKFEGDFTL